MRSSPRWACAELGRKIESQEAPQRPPHDGTADSERLVVRVLARALAHEEGLEFGRGLSTPDDAALWTLGPTGDVQRWIEVGAPTAERLHRSSKRCAVLQVFTHKAPVPLQREWSSRSVHRSDEVEIVQLPANVVASLAADLGRL